MKQRTLKLLISYDGTHYGGWQRQHNRNTIQQEIETALSTMLNSKIDVHGAGRTDAGVHALGMTAHFHTSKYLSANVFFRGLNSMLPRDIRILACSEENEDFHARFSATGKEYCYHIFTGAIQPPTNRLYSTHIPRNLQLDLMQQALLHLIGTQDFSSFEASGSRDRSITTGRGAVRTIYYASVKKIGDHELTLTLRGDGFLRHMVRNIAGTLIEVGKGKTSTEDFAEIIRAKDRSEAGPTAAAKGLFLQQVFYNNK